MNTVKVGHVSLAIALLILVAFACTGSMPPAQAAQTFQAVCNTDHIMGSWLGPERSTYKQAQADADAHNNSVHGGKAYAGVL